MQTLTKLLITLILVGMSSMGFSQISPVSLLDTSFTMLPFSNRVFEFYMEEAGEILFDVNVQKKTLLYMDVEEVPGILHFSSFKPENGLIKDSVNTEAHNRFRFHLRNESFASRYVKIKIRIKLAPVVVTRVLRDTLFAGIRYEDTLFVDTVRFESGYQPNFSSREAISILDTRVDLANVYDFSRERGSRFVLPVVLPQDRRVEKWAYWIGVGEESIAYFDKIENQFLGVEEPNELYTSLLDVYARDSLPAIPGTKAGEAIEYAFLDSMGAAIFLEGVPLRSLAGSRYRVAWEDYNKQAITGLEYNPMYLCLSNPYSVTAVSVFVKVLALVEQINFVEQPFKTLEP